MEKHCLNCDAIIIKKPHWSYNAFEAQKYCSKKCRTDASRNRIHINCKVCGKDLYIKPSDEKLGRGNYCSRDCFYKEYSQTCRGENHHNWKGGMYRHTDGYLRIKAEGHPRADRDGYVMEHILVVEEFIERFLKDDETVHHIDGNKSNNSPDNLYVFLTGGEHTAFHHTVNRGDKIILNSNLETYE